jgi:hypothetical protein
MNCGGACGAQRLHLSARTCATDAQTKKRKKGLPHGRGALGVMARARARRRALTRRTMTGSSWGAMSHVQLRPGA